MLEAIYQGALDAQRRIYPVVQKTPLVRSEPLSALADAPVWLKLDFTQNTGSFKLRGATNFIFGLPPEQRSRGVIAVSTGNHGRAVAYAGREAGVPVTVFLSKLVPENKVRALKSLGARVQVGGDSYDEAFECARDAAEAQGVPLVSPFDDPQILAGQATLGLELVEQNEEMEEILVPLSGGGLAGGILAAVKTHMPSVKVIGVTMESGAAMDASLQAGRPVEVEEVPTLADSLMGGIGLNNQFTFPLIRDHLDSLVLLSEEQILAGMKRAYFEHQFVLEGAAASSVGALMALKEQGKSFKNAVLILSGCNIDPKRFLALMQS